MANLDKLDEEQRQKLAACYSRAAEKAEAAGAANRKMNRHLAEVKKHARRAGWAYCCAESLYSDVTEYREGGYAHLAETKKRDADAEIVKAHRHAMQARRHTTLAAAAKGDRDWQQSLANKATEEAYAIERASDKDVPAA